MKRVGFTSLLICILIGSCAAPDNLPVLPIETEFFLLNFSRSLYLTAAIRPGDVSSGPIGQFKQSALIPPGGLMRTKFLDYFPEKDYPGVNGCPDYLDLRVHVYKRIHDVDSNGLPIPIGLDEDEAIDPEPVASGEIDSVLACAAVVASTYTIVLLDPGQGQPQLRVAQATGAERIVPLGDSPIDPPESMPSLLPQASIAGQVLSPGGEPIAGVGVLLRTRYRIQPDDSDECPQEENFACFSDPIDVTVTDEDGQFEFQRPPGTYRVEVFADSLQFSPDRIAVEAPIDNVTFTAEPLP